MVAGPRVITGLSEIADNYSGFIIDLWGVVHDGFRLFDPVLACLEELKAAQKQVVFLSNAPRSSGVVIDQLTDFGLPSSLYSGVLTSGDITIDYLRRHGATSYYHIGLPEKDSSVLVGIGMNPAPKPFMADIIICTNFEDARPQLEDYIQDMDRAIEKQIPMVCANPDQLVYRGDKAVYCSGYLAREYERRGGQVIYFGKPYKSTYDYLLSHYGASKWLAIGDALETDIKGAQNSNLESLLVLSGIHQNELSLNHQDNRDLYTKHGVAPSFISSRMTWIK